MAVNLIELVSQAMTPGAVQGISKFLGESDSAVQNGIATLVPVLLGGLASKASTPSGASGLLSLLNGPGVDSNLTDNFSKLLSSDQTSSLLQSGNSLLGGLFGADKVSGVSSALAGITGMKPGSATNLLMMAAPMVLSVLKRFIGEKRLDTGGVTALLAGQKDFLGGKLDPRLTSALGLGAPANLLSGLGEAAAGVGRGISAAGAAGAGAASAAVASASGFRRWLPWLIGAVIVLLLLTQFSRCGTTVDKAAPAATTAPAPAAPAAPTAVALPAKVYFETGKAELGADGTAIVKSVATLLATNPSAKVELTGFTDKTGDTAANEELSKKRAAAVKAALEAAGVAAGRVDMKAPMFVEIGAGGSDAEARRVDIAAAK